MQIPNEVLSDHNDLSELELQIIAELDLDKNYALGAGRPDWCKILCAVRTAATIVACAGNPVGIAAAVAAGIKCYTDCDRD